MMEAARLCTNRAAALKWYEKAAMRGNVEGMVRTGQGYAAMTQDAANRKKAIVWLTRGAQGGGRQAVIAVQALVALHRDNTDPAALHRWKSRALELGDMEIAYETAMDTLSADKPDAQAATRAVELLHKVTAEGSGAGDATRGMAFLRLAKCSFSGTGCAEGPTAGRKYYYKAAECGCNEAIQWVGHFDTFYNLNDADVANGLVWLKKAAATGDPGSMCRLGFCYVIGVGSALRADVKVGLDLLEKALQRGYHGAPMVLADLYGKKHNAMGRVRGDSPLAVDMAKAAHYYQIAAQQGDRKAMLRYADCLRDGSGVTRDVHAALALYLGLAEKNEVEGMLGAGQLYATDAELANRDLAIASFGNAVKADGSTFAMYRLGEIYAQAQDWPNALGWMEKAAAGGFVDAIVYLAQISLRTDVPGAPDKGKALERLKVAVKAGSVPAKRMLGLQLIYGQNIPKDLAAGVTMLSEPGVADGDVESCYWLGRAEYDRKKMSEAAKWFTRAVELGSYPARGSLLLIRLVEPGLVPTSLCLSWLKTTEEIERLLRFGVLAKPLLVLGDIYKQLALEKYRANPSDSAVVQACFTYAAQYYALAEKAGDEVSAGFRAYVGLGAGSSHDGSFRRAAIQQYEKDAGDGDVLAMKILSCIHSAHTQNPCADPDRMFKWTRQAADKGDAWAMLRLAYCHCLGIGVSQNYKVALKIFERLAKAKVGWGLFGEGMYYLYQDGSLFFNNYEGGIKLLQEARVSVPPGEATLFVNYNRDMMTAWLENSRKSKSGRPVVTPLASAGNQIDIPNPACCVPWIFDTLAMKVNAMTLADILPCSREWMATRMGQDAQTCFNGIVLPSTKILKAMS